MHFLFEVLFLLFSQYIYNKQIKSKDTEIKP